MGIELKELEQMREDAIKFRNMKGRYLDYANRLREAVKSLNALIDEMDPVFKKKRLVAQIGKYDEAMQDFLAVMRSGTHVGIEEIEKVYPALNRFTLFTRLRKTPGIEQRKDGRHTKLFMKKA